MPEVSSRPGSRDSWRERSSAPASVESLRSKASAPARPSAALAGRVVGCSVAFMALSPASFPEPAMPAPPRQPGPTLGPPFARGVIAADVLVDIGVQPAARFSQALHLDHMLQARMPGGVAVGTAVVEADADPVRPASGGGDVPL